MNFFEHFLDPQTKQDKHINKIIFTKNENGFFGNNEKKIKYKLSFIAEAPFHIGLLQALFTSGWILYPFYALFSYQGFLTFQETRKPKTISYFNLFSTQQSGHTYEWQYLFYSNKTTNIFTPTFWGAFPLAIWNIGERLYDLGLLLVFFTRYMLCTLTLFSLSMSETISHQEESLFCKEELEKTHELWTKKLMSLYKKISTGYEEL